MALSAAATSSTGRLSPRRVRIPMPLVASADREQAVLHAAPHNEHRLRHPPAGTDRRPDPRSRRLRFARTLRSARCAMADWAFYFSAALCAVFMVRVLGADWNSHFRAIWPDALFPKEGYVPIARLGPFRPRFYFAFRPIGYPLYLWAFGRSSHPAVIGQAALYCAAVLGLCTTAWKVFRSRVIAGLTIALILGIAVQPKYSHVDHPDPQRVALDHCWIRGDRRVVAFRRRTHTQARDLGLGIRHRLVSDSRLERLRGHRGDRSGCAVDRMASTELRQKDPAGAGFRRGRLGLHRRATRTSRRKAVDRRHSCCRISSAFASCPTRLCRTGSPSTACPSMTRCVRRSGKAGFEDTFWRSTDPKFARYFRWSNSSGRTTYARSLSRCRRTTATCSTKTCRRCSTPTCRTTTRITCTALFLIKCQCNSAARRRVKGLTIWLFLAGVALAATAGAAVRLRRRRYFGLALFGLVALALALSELFFAWFGEPLEIQRHAIGAVSMLAVLLVIIVATGVDAIVEMITAGRRKPDDTPNGEAPDSTIPDDSAPDDSAPDDDEAVSLGV